MSAHRGRDRTLVAVATLLAFAGAAAAQGPVYRNGFESPGNPGWTASRTTASRNGNTLLGPFQNESVSLHLENLARHTNVVIAIDLHVIGRWTGEGRNGEKPTVVSVTLDDGALLTASLANDDGDPARRQSFPDEPGAAAQPAGFGAYKVNSLGMVDAAGRPVRDSVYRLVLSAPHAGEKLKLSLSADNLTGGVRDAAWAIDNAVVYAVGDDVSLDAVRSAARDAVSRTAMGVDGPFTVQPASPPAVSASLPSGSRSPGWSDRLPGNLGALEVSLRPAAVSSQDSIIAGAMDAESRPHFAPPADEPLTLMIGRDLALVPTHEAEFVPAPAPARLEQPVTRRVSALVYQSRFGQAPGAEWSKPAHGRAPRGERFAGPFGDGSATLSLSDIPDHDQLIVDADFYAIGDWAGDGPDPSKLTISIDGVTVMAETFANERPWAHRTQSYPGGLDGRKPHLPGADSTALDSLGYAPTAADGVGDSTYHLRFVVPHAAGSAALKFIASGLKRPDGKDALWGLDNVTVVSSGDRAMSYVDATGVEPDDNADDGDYMNPFVRAPGDEWTAGTLKTAPSGEIYLGGLANETAALTVKNFPQHTHLTVAADVLVLGEWQGNGPDASRFAIKLSDGTVLLATSFATDGGAVDATQDYPDGAGGKNLPGAGAAGVGTLGYKDAGTGAARDAIYRVVFTVPHTAARETISFVASGLHTAKASWGLDNVTVVTSDGEMKYASGGGGTALGDAGALGAGNASGGTIGSYAQGDPLGGNPFMPKHPGGPPGDIPDPPGGGGGGGDPPVLPSPGTLPALLIGLAAAARRSRP